MRVSLIAAALITFGAAPLRAEYSQSLFNQGGRWIGYGWSEGYHAYDACPPRPAPPRPPMHLKWQPLIRPGATWPQPQMMPMASGPCDVPAAREELPPHPTPSWETLPPPTDESSTPPRAQQGRRLLKPSGHGRPGVVPIPRGLDLSPPPEQEVLPTSAIEIVAPPPRSSGRYPLTR